VRTISDRADDAAHGDFTHFVETVASPHSAAIVQALLV
jgi:adenosylhomocysteine nucleosidase